MLVAALTKENANKAHTRVGDTFADTRVWRKSILALGLVIGVYAVSFRMPSLIKEAGVTDTTQIGWLSAIPNLVTVPSMLLLARSSEMLRERRLHVTCGATVGAIGLIVCGAFGGHLLAVVIGLSLATAGLISAIPIQWSFVTALLTGSSGAAAIGLVNSVSNFGGLMSPQLIGMSKETTGNVDTGLMITAAFSLDFRRSRSLCGSSVFVNGQHALEDGVPTGHRAGRVLRRGADNNEISVQGAAT